MRKTIKIKGEILTIIKEYKEFYLVTDEFLMEYKRVPKAPKLTVIK